MKVARFEDLTFLQSLPGRPKINLVLNVRVVLFILVIREKRLQAKWPLPANSAVVVVVRVVTGASVGAAVAVAAAAVAPAQSR